MSCDFLDLILVLFPDFVFPYISSVYSEHLGFLFFHSISFNVFCRPHFLQVIIIIKFSVRKSPEISLLRAALQPLFSSCVCICVMIFYKKIDKYKLLGSLQRLSDTNISTVLHRKLQPLSNHLFQL